PAMSRLAWCYGDPGLAVTLLVAARGAGVPEWEKAAVDTAVSAAARPYELSRIRDAGLCHGSAGIAHLFNRLYQATGEPRLAEAARFWFDWTLEFRQPGNGVAGFRSWNTDTDGGQMWRGDAGFLEGAAGVGLALLAATSPIEPEWDRLLLAGGRLSPLR
ncbi:MAG TPA: lanthionine synthetase LanC family protein, partial [Thermoanaerobaculia bacterium]|nr:lanthionine synthetase LanC family protein [Thermoanaerobaculia bacterium]